MHKVNRAAEKVIVQAVKPVVDAANRSEIARRTGITLSHVSRVLSGKRVPSSNKLAEIAFCLNVSMNDLHIYLSTLRPKGPRNVAA
jgi:transcriptional regulator with XRE-family HTH domain